jgi:putative membrane-bound dehydrogenase-like protein
MTFRLAILCGLICSGTMIARELAGTYLPSNTPCPTPEEARAKMTVPEGYEVRCFAHEPMVQNPVAMTWDARGRLWVVEAYEYPTGSKHPAPFGAEAKDDQYQPMPPGTVLTEHGKPNTNKPLPRDRVIILEDTDNDGTADKRTVFVEGLNLASAIICGDNGIYVGQQPHLIHFVDANGDDKPEHWRVVLTGFGREDTHELVNSFIWGPDGWLYMTHGVFTHSKVRRPGQPESEGFKFDAGIGRARPLPKGSAGVSPAAKKKADETPALPSWEFEVFADGTSNPWGCDYDERGNFFVSACVIDHFFHMAPGGIYVRQGGAPENPYAYEQLPSIVKHKHFRAAYAGVQIYQGGVYPKDTWGHAFIGNIHDNAIHEEVITPVGATFKCEPRRDFLRANDGWFRPVSTQTGPDGNLWIMDWCDKYPCYQNAKANPEGVDRERGRIWRVLHARSENERSADTPVRNERLRASSGSGDARAGKSAHAPVASRPTKDMNLTKLSTVELVKVLEHPNNWMRRMARRLLGERMDGRIALSEDAASLRSIFSDDSSAPGSREVLWLATSLRRSFHAVHHTPPFVFEMRSDDPVIVSWSVRAIGELLRSDATSFPVFSEALVAAMELDDPSVQSAVLTTMRQIVAQSLTANHSVPRMNDAILGAVRRILLNTKAASAHQAWMVLEPLIGFNPQEALSSSSGVLSNDSTEVSASLTQHTMRRLCDTRKSENLDLAIEFLSRIKEHPALLASALFGLVKGQEGGVIKPTKPFSELFAELAKSSRTEVRNQAETLATLWGDGGAIDRLAGTMLDSSTLAAVRTEALQTLRKVRNPTAKKAYAALVAQVSDLGGVALEVMRAASDLGDDSFAVLVLAGWKKLSLPVQLAALDAFSSRTTWTRTMLEAIQAGSIPSAGFPVSVRRQLAKSGDKSIQELANKVLGAWKESSDDIKSLITDKRKACLEGEPDLAAGKALFTTTCAVCHVFHGGGQKVGPDLIGSGRSNLDALLANVIDPNQIIGNGYENVIVNTKDNRTLMGRITEDAPAHVKLLAIGGAETVIGREQIAKLDNTKQSLMPMGFGGLPDDQFRNLIWYILAPPEEGPLTAEKKKLLSTSIDAGEEKPKSRWAAIDWESVSLWNPLWKVKAPEFERTPLKLADYHGRSNVLLTHPFPDKQTPSVLEYAGVAKKKLKFSAAADDRGDWKARVLINGNVVKEVLVDHTTPRWKEVEVDVSDHAGKEVTVRLEGHATGWAWEFGYWHDVRWE